MKTQIIPLIAALIVLLVGRLNGNAQGTVFTYQGRLDSSGASFTGNAEFQATLWSAVSGGAQVAANNPAAVSVPVTNGLFVLPLDFGANFPGADRWLQLEVRTTLGPFTRLSPRQRLTATPYAITAGSAANVSGTVPPAALNNAWKTSGNTGTTPGTHFLGTTDGQPLELRAARVGIGTASPRATLHVQSERAGGGDNTATFSNTNLGPWFSHIHYGTTGTWYIRSASTNGRVILQDAGGNVGIGTASPTAKLHVNGTARVEGDMTIGANATIRTIGGFAALGRSRVNVLNNFPLVPNTSYVELNASGPAGLNSTTAIADGPAIGAILILVGAPTTHPEGVSIPNNANTRLSDSAESGDDHILGPNDTMMLIWNGSDWVQLSETEYRAP